MIVTPGVWRGGALPADDAVAWLGVWRDKDEGCPLVPSWRAGRVAGGAPWRCWRAAAADMADDEFAAFQAELNQLEAPAKAAVGPRAPQVITAKPQGPTPVKAREPIPLPQPVMGGPRVPVAQWPKPEKLVAEIQQEYPKNPMQLSALHKESGGAPSGSSGAGGGKNSGGPGSPRQGGAR